MIVPGDLDDLKRVAQIDRSGMRELLLRFPEQLARAWQLSVSVPDFERLIVCGMGGSAVGGDYLRVYLTHKRFPKPVFVIRGYELPPFADANTLIFAVSYSGNTEETLSCVAEAVERDCHWAALTSDGRLAELARAHGAPIIQIPKGMPPRTALGYLFLPMLKSLQCFLDESAVETELTEALDALKKLAARYAEAPEAENPAERLAHAWHGHIPIIYGSHGLTDVVARRWKAQINENAEAPAFCNVVPELQHNELMGWEHEPHRELFVYTLLRDPDEHPQIKRRFELSRSFLEDQGSLVLEFSGEGEGLLARLLSLSYLGDWASFYLAILYARDPTPVPLIDTLKARLTQ